MSDHQRPDPQQGIFETLLVIGGRPVELEAHLKRLAASLDELYPDREAPDLGEVDVPSFSGPYGYSIDGTSGGARSSDAALGSMRVTVAPNGDGALEARIALREAESTLVFDRRSVALHTLRLSGGLGAHKWADRSLLDEAQSRLPADALPLVIDRDGTVLEAARANVFAVQAGTLVTPPTDGRILPGVTRARVMEIADAAGFETRETELPRDDLLAADEVFLTGSVRGIEQVRAFDGAELATGGEVGSLIAAELRRTWAGAVV